jgi:hypothetical protein
MGAEREGEMDEAEKFALLNPIATTSEAKDAARQGFDPIIDYCEMLMREKGQAIMDALNRGDITQDEADHAIHILSPATTASALFAIAMLNRSIWASAVSAMPESNWDNVIEAADNMAMETIFSGQLRHAEEELDRLGIIPKGEGT